ncbi:MAG TPA: MerR family transcriptional regulator [Bacteroidales bacterium]|nr:MerR family transcriptional regulator [Bacteroidales bacterium]
MSQYSIKDLEKLTGIKAHTIRIWEKRYGIVNPARTESNIRLYSNCDLKRLLNISILNKHGLKISNLAVMSADELNDRVLNLMSNQHAYEHQIENLVMAMVDFNETRFEKTLGNAVIELGFEETLMKIVYPFFQKTGILWQTGAISPAHEHFVSNLVRQKIIAAIENLEPKHPPRAKLFLLFLHETEYHELGLLFYHYIIKKVGHRVMYLGQATPIEDVRKAASIHHPDYLLTNFTSPISSSDIDSYLHSLTFIFPGIPICISGMQLNGHRFGQESLIRHVPGPMEFKQDLVELLR